MSEDAHKSDNRRLLVLEPWQQELLEREREFEQPPPEEPRRPWDSWDIAFALIIAALLVGWVVEVIRQ